MKRLSIFLIFCLGVSGLFAQVSITSDNFMNVPGGMADVTWMDTTGGIAFPKRGANLVWDYSASFMTFKTSQWTYEAAESTAFPEATVKRAFTQTFLGSLPQNGQDYWVLNAAGFSDLGRIFEETKGVFPTGANDSIVSLAQTMRRIPSAKRMQFPLTYETAWADTGRSDFKALVTLSLAGWNKDTARLRQHYFASDTIIGWGQLMMPGGKNYDVLLKKRYSAVVDSYYVRNAPVPAQILGALGLQNGMRSESWIYEFLAPGATDYVARIVSSDGSKVSGFFYNTNTTPTSVVKSFERLSLTVYPNPTGVDAGVTVRFAQPLEQPAELCLLDLTGRTIWTKPAVAGSLELKTTTAQLAGGVYLLQVRTLNGEVLTTQKLMVR